MSLTLLRKIYLLQLLGSSVTGKSDASDHGRPDPGSQESHLPWQGKVPERHRRPWMDKGPWTARSGEPATSPTPWQFVRGHTEQLHLIEKFHVNIFFILNVIQDTCKILSRCERKTHATSDCSRGCSRGEGRAGAMHEQRIK